MTLDFFVKLMYQSSTIILSVGIKYYLRDLLCDVVLNLIKAAINTTYIVLNK